MNTRITLSPGIALLALVLLPMAALAAPAKTHTAKPSHKAVATMYECQTCHMKVSAAVAKKDHFKDPMDGGKLVPINAGTKKPPTAKPMGGMSM